MTSSEQPAEVRQRGRSVRSHTAILEATSHLLAEVGYGALTIEGVAARAGVGKATVYRWWPSKGALTIEAMTTTGMPESPAATGDLRKDLVASVERAIEVLSRDPQGTVIPAMTADLSHDPALAEQFRERILRPRRSVVADMITRAIDRGELPADADVQLLLDICVGAVFYRLVVSGEPITADFAERLVSLLLDGARSTS